MREATTAILVPVDPGMSAYDLLARRVDAAPEHPAFLRATDSGWQSVTTAEFSRQVDTAAAELLRRGVDAGDPVLVMGATSYAWAVADFAVWRCGAISVPVYPTASPAQVAAIVTSSAARIGIVDDDRRSRLASCGVEELRFADLEAPEPTAAELADLGRRSHGLGGAEVATIVFTSGSTGEPRGVEITHTNLVSQAWNVGAAYSSLIHERASTVIFLPLAHILARGLQVAAVSAGMTVAHVADPARAVASLAEVRPSFLVVAPRVLDKILERVRANAASRHLGRVFAAAERVAVRRGRVLEAADVGRREPWPSWDRLAHRAADAVLFARIRELLGGRLECLLSGSAPLPVETGLFFRGIGIPVIEGYGLTETTAPATGNLPGAIRSGSVGVPVPGTTVRIADDGEVQIAGPGVCRGYHGEPAGSGFTPDGFLRTGDLGRLDDDGHLWLTGRAKDVVVTSSGKNIVPARWERLVERDGGVDHAVLVGDRRPYAAALLFVPDAATPRAGSWSQAVVEDPARLAALQRAVDAANATVSRAEQVKRWLALRVPLTEEAGQLTPTGKVRRGTVLHQAGELIDRLYAVDPT